MAENFANRFRLLLPEKTIWLYTGYTYLELLLPYYTNKPMSEIEQKRWDILSKIDILIDGRYIDSQRDVSLKWRGSSNQRVIDVKKSLQENKITLYCD